MIYESIFLTLSIVMISYSIYKLAQETGRIRLRYEKIYADLEKRVSEIERREALRKEYGPEFIAKGVSEALKTVMKHYPSDNWEEGI